MYVCVYVCMYVYVCVCMCMYVYVCVCMCMYVYVCVCMCMYVYVCAYMICYDMILLTTCDELYRDVCVKYIDIICIHVIHTFMFCHLLIWSRQCCRSATPQE